MPLGYFPQLRSTRVFMALQCVSGLATAGFGFAYWNIAPKFSVLSKIPLKAQMSAFALSAIVQGIFTTKCPPQENEGLSLRRAFEVFTPYVLIGSVLCLSHRQAFKASLACSAVLGTVQLVASQLPTKIIGNQTDRTSKIIENQIDRTSNTSFVKKHPFFVLLQTKKNKPNLATANEGEALINTLVAKCDDRKVTRKLPKKKLDAFYVLVGKANGSLEGIIRYINSIAMYGEEIICRTDPTKIDHFVSALDKLFKILHGGREDNPFIRWVFNRTDIVHDYQMVGHCPLSEILGTPSSLPHWVSDKLSYAWLECISFLAARELFDEQNAHQNILDYNFFHGTSSLIFTQPSLQDQKLCLQSSGALIKSGVYPLSGELILGGSCAGGVNESYISGTCPRFAYRAREYATVREANTNMEQTKKTIMKFLQRSFDDSNPSCTAFWISEGLGMSILCIKAQEPKWFEENKQPLLDKLDKAEQQFNAFYQTEEFKNKMPQDLDPEGIYGFKYPALDYYYYNLFRQYAMDLEQIKDRCEQNITLLEDEINMNEHYGILFAGRNVQRTFLDKGEVGCSTRLELGTDIFTAFVEKGNVEKLRTALSERSVTNVQIKTFEEFDSLMKVYREKTYPHIQKFIKKKLSDSNCRGRPIFS